MIRLTVKGKKRKKKKRHNNNNKARHKKRPDEGKRPLSPQLKKIKYTPPSSHLSTSFLFLRPIRRGKAALFSQQKRSTGHKAAKKKVQLK